MRWGSERVARGALAGGALRRSGRRCRRRCVAARPRAARRPRTRRYGRIDGDLTLVGGAGAVRRPARPARRGRAAPPLPRDRRPLRDVRGRAALRLARPSRGASSRRGSSSGRSFSFRWLDGHETSGARLDLVVDSIGLELGAAFQQPTAAPSRRGRAPRWGSRSSSPSSPSATGPWLGVPRRRALERRARWREAPTGSPDDRSLYLSITAAWHQVVLSHAVDVGDGPADGRPARLPFFFSPCRTIM